MVLASMSFVPLALSKWKLRVQRLSSLERRETASLKGYRGLRGPLDKCPLEVESANDGQGGIGNSGLGLVLPSESALGARSPRRLRYEARRGENLAGKPVKSRHKDT